MTEKPLDTLEVYVTTTLMKEKQFFDKGIVKVEKIYLKSEVEEMLKNDFIPKSVVPAKEDLDYLISKLRKCKCGDFYCKRDLKMIEDIKTLRDSR